MKNRNEQPSTKQKAKNGMQNRNDQNMQNKNMQNKSMQDKAENRMESCKTQ